MLVVYLNYLTCLRRWRSPGPLNVTGVTLFPSPLLQGVLPVSFEQSSPSVLIPGNDLTRHNSTYTCPLVTSADPRYITSWYIVRLCILWTVQVAVMFPPAFLVDGLAPKKKT